MFRTLAGITCATLLLLGGCTGYSLQFQGGAVNLEKSGSVSRYTSWESLNDNANR